MFIPLLHHCRCDSEYILSYNFFQDGTITFEAKLSGILSTSLAPSGEVLPPFGVRVAPGVNATVHQVWKCGNTIKAKQTLDGTLPLFALKTCKLVEVLSPINSYLSLTLTYTS